MLDENGNAKYDLCSVLLNFGLRMQCSNVNTVVIAKVRGRVNNVV